MCAPLCMPWNTPAGCALFSHFTGEETKVYNQQVVALSQGLSHAEALYPVTFITG
jgi:hypothetical protein